ncbi:MAG: hypothetical protein Fur0042_08930 [Cyanophyceae cyanobacterium]
MQVKGMMARGLMGALLAVPLAIAAAVPALAQDLMVEVHNESSGTIEGLYVVPAGAGDWGDNLLEGVMGPDDAVEVSIEDDETICEYEIYAVYDDGGDYEDTVDLCETEAIVISD